MTSKQDVYDDAFWCADIVADVADVVDDVNEDQALHVFRDEKKICVTSAAQHTYSLTKNQRGRHVHQISHDKNDKYNMMYHDNSQENVYYGQQEALCGSGIGGGVAPHAKPDNGLVGSRAMQDYVQHCFGQHRHIISHDYHDHSQDNIEEEEFIPFPHSGGAAESFPAKLHRLLEDAVEDGRDGIIHWLPHGRAFIVEDQKKLENDILGVYFRHKNWRSFSRQLSLYGFRRLVSGTDRGQ